MSNLMSRTIEKAVRGTAPRTAGRMRALASVRWILATDDGRFVKVGDDAKVVLTPDASVATVYDGRDNEAMKARFMQALLRVTLTVVLLD